MQIEIPRSIILKSASLVADSPKKAFYNLYVTKEEEGYLVIKDSGTGDRILDHRSWPADSYESADKMFKQKLRTKLNPNRRNPRKYKVRAKIAA